METNEMGAHEAEFSAHEMEQVKEARRDILLRAESKKQSLIDIINEAQSYKPEVPAGEKLN